MRTSTLNSFRIRIGKLRREMRAVHCSGGIQAIIEEGERQPTGTPCRQCKEQLFADGLGAPSKSLFVPRHWPYRHGRYQDDFSGSDRGEKSSPLVPQGWQRQSRASVIQLPAQSPKRPTASSAYCEQVGRCRQWKPIRPESVWR